MIFKKSDFKLIIGENDLLRTPPEPWDFEKDGDGKSVANILIDRLNDLGGIGLSANQVSLSKRIFVIAMNDFTRIFFNPEIISQSSEEVSDEEGCLSFPGVFLQVKRPKEVVIRYQDELGEWNEEHFTGLTARVVLHEYDHMLGLIMKDRVSQFKWDFARKKAKNKRNKFIKTKVVEKLREIHDNIQKKQSSV